MYLVHAGVLNSRGLPPKNMDPALLRRLIGAHAAGTGLEHVVVHVDDLHLTIGLFLRSDSLARAESAALALCRRALAADARLAGHRVVHCRVPLLPFLFDSPPNTCR
ncbi:hypothetical protein [Embleya sp. NPDC005575]|uniref:hypothetical protein n=1 Tax=Embleya sp. NPDC005575 TaxID=3156892 RepID=UPI00339F5858